MYTVLVSRTFQKQFQALRPKLQNRIRSALEELAANPFEPRSGVDIKPLSATKPRKQRLRVGDYRIIYLIDDDEVKVIEVFKRGKEY